MKTPEKTQPKVETKQPQPFYKNWWFWAIIVAICIFAIVTVTLTTIFITKSIMVGVDHLNSVSKLEVGTEPETMFGGEDITLTRGTYVVGEDIKAGGYDFYVASGSSRAVGYYLADGEGVHDMTMSEIKAEGKYLSSREPYSKESLLLNEGSAIVITSGKAQLKAH